MPSSFREIEDSNSLSIGGESETKPSTEGSRASAAADSTEGLAEPEGQARKSDAKPSSQEAAQPEFQASLEARAAKLLPEGSGEVVKPKSAEEEKKSASVEAEKKSASAEIDKKLGGSLEGKAPSSVGSHEGGSSAQPTDHDRELVPEEMKVRWDSKSKRAKNVDEDAPVDKMNLVFMIILLNGIGVLLPWNMFITIAPNYYVEYWFTVDGNKTDYAKTFMSDLGIAAQIPNFLVGLINVLQIVGGSLMIRIAGPLTVNCINVVVILILIVAQNPAKEAMCWFYFVTMVIIVVLNASNGLYQNSVFGLTADFPAAYTNALIVGNNVCGTFISLLAILTIVAFPSDYKLVALIYFSIVLVVLILCGVSLLTLTKLDFYKYYLEKGDEARAAENATRPSLSQFCDTFKGCWMQLISVFLVFFVTLAVFPAVMAGITPNGKGEPWNSSISRELYPGITVFLNFNLMAALGSTTANFVQFPGPKLLIYPVLARLLFIPYFMLCNFNVEDRVMPVWFKNEWFFIVGNIVMAYTSGYFSSLAMMYAPRVVHSSLAKTAGMASALFLISGLMCGVAFVPVIIHMVNTMG